MKTEPSTEGTQKRTMSPAARKKISDSQKARHAGSQPGNFQGQLRALISTTRGLTPDELKEQVEACIATDGSIGSQADRHTVRELVTALDRATAERMTA